MKNHQAFTMIKIRSVSHRFNMQTLLQFNDWEIKKGEHWLLQGKSGTGKTTLLHIISGLLKPEQGSVEINGHRLYALSGNRLDHFRGTHIGIVFQQPHLMRNLTLAENLLAAQYFAGLKQDTSRVNHIIDSLGLSGKTHSYPEEMSQGQMQRVSIARAVVNSPAVIIADEPTSSLDDENASVVIDLLKEMAGENNSAMIIATHDQRLKPYFSTTYTLDPSI